MTKIQVMRSWHSLVGNNLDELVDLDDYIAASLADNYEGTQIEDLQQRQLNVERALSRLINYLAETNQIPLNQIPSILDSGYSDEISFK